MKTEFCDICSSEGYNKRAYEVFSDLAICLEHAYLRLTKVLKANDLHDDQVYKEFILLGFQLERQDQEKNLRIEVLERLVAEQTLLLNDADKLIAKKKGGELNDRRTKRPISRKTTTNNRRPGRD